MRTHAKWLLPALLCATPLAGQQPASPPAVDYQISLGFSGDTGPEDGLNPSTVLYRRWPGAGTMTLGYINYRHPGSVHEVAVAVGLSDSAAAVLLAALDSCALVRRDSAGWRLTFAVFDDDVWAAFDTVIGTIAARIHDRLTSEVLPQLAALYGGSRLAARGVPLGVAAPVIITALGLDERAIQQLESRGLVHIRVRHPGGRMYGVLAQRHRRSVLRVPLWGIHGMGLRGVMFEVFGDNGVMNQRRSEIGALPDLAWSWRSAGTRTAGRIDSLVSVVASLTLRFGNDWFRATALADSERAELGELTQTGLLETPDSLRWRLAFPVIEAADVALFEPMVARVAQIAVEAVLEDEPRLAAAYAGTVPAASGVPLAEALNLVYHTAYSTAFAALLREQPFGFAREAGALRYTGYAIQR